MSRAMKSKQDSNSTDQFPFAPVFFSIYFSVLLYIFVSVTVGTGHGRVYACSSRPEISVAKVSSTSRSHPRTPRQSSLQWIFPALFRWKRCQSLSTSPRATLRPHINSARGQRFNPWSGKIQHASEELSLCATTTKPSAPTTEARTPVGHNQ